MSIWAYINGTITLDVEGKTQVEGEYLLKNTLQYLPDVIPNPNSERQFDIFINQPIATNQSISHDEYGVCVSYPKYNIENMNRFAVPYNYRYHDGWIDKNSRFILTIHGSFRDCTFTDCLKSFNNWLCRLSSRLWVTDMLIRVTGIDRVWNKKTQMYDYDKYKDKSIIITDDVCAYGSMYDPE